VNPWEQPSKLFWWTLGRQRDPADANRMRAPSTAGAIVTVVISLLFIGGAAIIWIAWVPAVAVVVGLLGVMLLLAGILGWRESRWEGRLQDGR
jgi:CHASE2 domain-containing sensor protein